MSSGFDIDPARELSEPLSNALLQCSPDCIKVLDAAGKVEFFNEQGLCVMEIDDISLVKGVYWPDLWPPESRSLLEGALIEARDRGAASFQAFCPTAKGRPKFWDVALTILPGGGGRYVIISRDITLERAAQDSQRLSATRDRTMAKEMAHRINNTLTVVTGIFQQTLRNAASLEDLGSTFSQRILAMANANTALIQGEWAGADLCDLARIQLGPFIDAKRISVEGPDVILPVEVSQSVALVLNELATNALKYGALSASGGKVSLWWELVPDGVQIRWQESGGPEVTKPSRIGAGSRLIDHSIPGAVIERDFAATGLVCGLRIPLR